MSRPEENGRKGTLELLCLFLPSVLWLTDLSIEDGILYFLNMFVFFICTYLLLRKLWRRQIDVRALSSIAGFAIVFMIIKLVLVIVGNASENPLPHFVGLWGAYLGFQYLTAPIGRIYNEDRSGI